MEQRAAIYVSVELRTAIVYGAGVGEDCEFDGVPMRRVSAEWLSWLRKHHKGTMQDALELKLLLDKFPQPERHSAAQHTPEGIGYEWNRGCIGIGCEEGADSERRGGKIVDNNKDGLATAEKGGDRVLQLWEPKASN